MRTLLALIIIIYLVGVGVALAPTIRDRWSVSSASAFASDIVHELPHAIRWPVRAIRSIQGNTSEHS
jgi:hypothetical protein